MPATDTKAKLRCEAPGCEHRAYSNASNLKRHIRSKHGRAVQMSCGKSFPSHQSNIKRHKITCGCDVVVQTPMTATTNTMTTPTFDDTFDLILDDLKDAYYPVDNNLFGSFQ
ncbi:hypothetical protein CPAR01_08874 [Colletotrichum paranaense]|uniref:C2H2-type domain-containing protein n=1 Tax=Colletotrichum paranaense TaxID=1914294 RepID=A0ABQ9SFC6_9PEZI|nr:uncharacterized protein CPAR01_08874 [Colletotrichum paranaense]KAK1535332.1 hypothetical protein CPAR01_08874 [Colletotrichum paranaense]